jgi:hypothetical protein
LESVKRQLNITVEMHRREPHLEWCGHVGDCVIRVTSYRVSRGA